MRRPIRQSYSRVGSFLDPEDGRAVREYARARGVSVAELIRRLLLATVRAGAPAPPEPE